MTDWMQALAEQYRSARRRCPDDDLVLVFDIDDTILDMRHMVRHVLLEYDRVHATRFFYGLAVEDLERHDNRIEKLLEGFDVPSAAGGSILEWCRSNRKPVMMTFEGIVPPETPDQAAYLALFEEVVNSFPEVRFCLMHMGFDELAQLDRIPMFRVVDELNQRHGNVWFETASMDSNRKAPKARAGVELCVLVALPNCPLLFSPQQYTADGAVPSLASTTAQV